MTPETVTGLVLSSGNIGETDRRIVILTRERGKISAFARGAVKPKNPLVSATQAFTFGEFFLTMGRDSYTVTGAEVKNHFPGLIKDIEKYYYAAYFCEIASFYTRENLNAEDELLLLYMSLAALEKGAIPNRLVRYIYEWRMLLLNGEYPSVNRCVRCGKTEDLAGLDMRKHGLVCSSCAGARSEAQVVNGVRKQADNGARGQAANKNEIAHVDNVVHNPTYGVISLRSSTIYTLRYIMAAKLQALYSFTLKDDVLEEFGVLTEEYLEKTQNYNFNSLNGIEEFL